MSEKINLRTLHLHNSMKNANYGKVGNFNNLKRITLSEEGGHVTLSFYSRKTDAPGQIIRFTRDDFRKFQEFIFPVVESFEGQHGIEIPVEKWSTDNIGVGLDQAGNPVVTLHKEDRSLRIYWSEIINWSNSRYRVRLMPKHKERTNGAG